MTNCKSLQFFCGILTKTGRNKNTVTYHWVNLRDTENLLLKGLHNPREQLLKN
jgi:hypothetical protein